MLTFGLLAIVVSGGTIFTNYITSNYFFSTSQYQLTDQATFVARQITTELRQAEEAMDGSYPLEILDDNEIAFFTDLDNDGLIERRRYFVDGNALKREVINPSGDPPVYQVGEAITTLVVDNLDLSKLPLFVYYNSEWPEDQVNNPLTYWLRPLETRLIRIRVPVMNRSDLAGVQGFVAENIVNVRNLRIEL